MARRQINELTNTRRQLLAANRQLTRIRVRQMMKRKSRINDRLVRDFADFILETVSRVLGEKP